MKSQITIMDAPFVRKLKEFPLAAALCAAVIVSVYPVPAGVFFGSVPNDLWIRTKQNIISPALQFLPAGGHHAQQEMCIRSYSVQLSAIHMVFPLFFVMIYLIIYSIDNREMFLKKQELSIKYRRCSSEKPKKKMPGMPA